MRGLLFIVAVSLLVSRAPARAVTIVAGPSFTKATNAPLAGVLRLMTDAESRVCVSVDDGVQTWVRSFHDFSLSHEIALAGFKAGRANAITVTVYDKQREVATAAPVVFVTDPLPSDFPIIALLQSKPGKMEPGYTLFRVAINYGRKGYQTIVDNSGEVVWYASLPSAADVRQVEDGNLFIFTGTNFSEINLLGETVRTWRAPGNLPIDLHEGLMTGHGTILYLSGASTVVSNYPTSATDPAAPTATARNVLYQRVVEISATNAALLNNWSLITMVDPRRITYLTTLGPYVWDSEHSNAVFEDPRDNSIIASLRHQNAVVKFSRTGQLKWILAPPAGWGEAWQPYLLRPVGTPFDWTYGQHAPAVTPRGTLMVYDDGNFRASPFDTAVPDANNYSRAVEYSIDEGNMTVSQVWDYGRTNSPRFYTDKVGSAESLPLSGNVLVTFGSVQYVDGAPPSEQGPYATMGRIQEVTHDTTPEVVFDLSLTEYDNPFVIFWDCYVYRSYRIPDLYAHPPAVVADLTVGFQSGTAWLEFSADPARSYSVEASADLVHWTELGLATWDKEAELFRFQDSGASDFQSRYYRVITH